MRNKEEERQKSHWFDFSKHPVLFATHKEQRLLLYGVKRSAWGAYVAACTAQRQQKDSNPFPGPLFNLHFGNSEEILRIVCGNE